jgi:hypothetical protein
MTDALLRGMSGVQRRRILSAGMKHTGVAVGRFLCAFAERRCVCDVRVCAHCLQLRRECGTCPTVMNAFGRKMLTSVECPNPNCGKKQCLYCWDVAHSGRDCAADLVRLPKAVREKEWRDCHACGNPCPLNAALKGTAFCKKVRPLAASLRTSLIL